MKLLFLAILFAFTTGSLSQAQGSGTQTQQANKTPKTLELRAEEITKGMARNLRLTPDQTQKLYTINLSAMQQAEEAKTKYKDDPRKTVQQMDIISQTRLSQVKDLLTPAQFQQYQNRREEKMGVPREARSNPAARQQSQFNQNSY